MYSTCSLEQRQNEDVVKAFLKEEPSARIKPLNINKTTSNITTHARSNNDGLLGVDSSSKMIDMARNLGKERCAELVLRQVSERCQHGQHEVKVKVKEDEYEDEKEEEEEEDQGEGEGERDRRERDFGVNAAIPWMEGSLTGTARLDYRCGTSGLFLARFTKVEINEEE